MFLAQKSFVKKSQRKSIIIIVKFSNLNETIKIRLVNEHLIKTKENVRLTMTKTFQVFDCQQLKFNRTVLQTALLKSQQSLTLSSMDSYLQNVETLKVTFDALIGVPNSTLL